MQKQPDKQFDNQNPTRSYIKLTGPIARRDLDERVASDTDPETALRALLRTPPTKD